MHHILLVALLAIGLGACGPVALADEISAAELHDQLASQHPPLVLDVRSPEEFAVGHIPGALNIPHDQVGARLAEIPGPRERLVVTHCVAGVRAGKAEAVLAEAGFTELRHLAGDIGAWRDAGFTMSTAENAR